MGSRNNLQQKRRSYFYFIGKISQFPVCLANFRTLEGLSLSAVTDSGMLQSAGARTETQISRNFIKMTPEVFYSLFLYKSLDYILVKSSQLFRIIRNLYSNFSQHPSRTTQWYVPNTPDPPPFHFWPIREKQRGDGGWMRRIPWAIFTYYDKWTHIYHMTVNTIPSVCSPTSGSPSVLTSLSVAGRFRINNKIQKK